MPAIKIGIIGCGAIGSELARALVKETIPGARLQALNDIVEQRAQTLAQALHPRPKVLVLHELARACDLLVEAAGISAVSEIAATALRQKKDLMVLSVGALLDQPKLFKAFQKKARHLYFPSGAVAGLDALKAAVSGGHVTKVLLTTRKPPQGLSGAVYFQKRNLDPHRLKIATKIFSGTAREAIRLFPANVNVAASIALAGLGPDHTWVEIIADPAAQRNSHTLEVEGSFGKFTAITENVPFPANPKTSCLAAWSALALLQSIVRHERKGT